MASTVQQANFTDPATFFPAAPVVRGRQINLEDRYRVYALAFLMTDHELLAEELMERAFDGAFTASAEPTREIFDGALIAELRKMYPIGLLSLDEPVCEEVLNIRRNTLRVHLERAVVQLPPTERLIFLMHDVEGYSHERISKLLAINPEQSQFGLHQARLRVRSLIASMPR